ncbi:response regulator transcription factor [Lapillicoccus jejuensis]|uniref:LuxR family two component transcriptional regulator n=1 Tax=Lapillicoccus jejuensis TaxID=402171 RepID=A0A542E5D9_9MICO|nr:response regulator transcription factor [Lapillicoccus jejuensis]TQJ10506.1 LuxR family two component transcriptional regulator [Lapillicoccus jejuensis]
MSSPGAERPVRVLVVDDHLVFAQLLGGALGAEPDLECVGTASSVAEALRLVREVRPDLVVMDVRLDDGDGVDATAALTAEHPDLRVVVLSAYVDAALLARAERSGACALLPKNGRLDETLEVLRLAERGGFLVPPRFLRSLTATRPPADPGLSPRELEVLRMLSAGVAVPTLARELEVTVGEARSLVACVLAKLGAGSPLEAVVAAARRGLVHAAPPA